MEEGVSGLMDESKGFTDKTLAQRARELKLEALDEIAKVSARITNATDSLNGLKEERLAAIKVGAGLGLEKEELAKAAGVSPSTIGNWIRPPEAVEVPEDPRDIQDPDLPLQGETDPMQT